MEALLETRNLSAAYCSRAGNKISALENVSFRLAPGEILGVLGESGSGKSTLALSLLRVLPPNGTQRADAILFEGKNLCEAHSQQMRAVRGNRVSLIFQESATALHPAIRAGAQVAEVLRAHKSLNARERSSCSRAAMKRVFSAEVERIFYSFPHQLSGGQRQRIAIAQAIVCEPSLLIADEPTASLDPVSQSEVIELLKRLRHELGLAILFITHVPDLLVGFADRVMVMYGGQIIEDGPTARVLRAPLHPYTKALLQCRPAFREARTTDPARRLPVIPGDSPALRGARRSCVFEPRCPERMPVCSGNQPPLVTAEESGRVLCFLYAR